MEHKNSQSGNALIYVLIAIALFAALSFVMGRQTDSSESGVVADEQIKLYAVQLIDYTAQVKSVVEQMSFSGTFPEDLTFFLPGDANYESEATHLNIYKIFHPAGGGLNLANLPEGVRAGNGTEVDPAPGWYMGRFNDINGTPTAAHDIVLVAYKIARPVCAAINEKITGTTAIPALTGKARNFFIKESPSTPVHIDSTANGHGGSANADLIDTSCAGSACEGMPTLCVSNDTADVFAFYSVVGGL